MKIFGQKGNEKGFSIILFSGKKVKIFYAKYYVNLKSGIHITVCISIVYTDNIFFLLKFI